MKLWLRKKCDRTPTGNVVIQYFQRFLRLSGSLSPVNFVLESYFAHNLLYSLRPRPPTAVEAGAVCVILLAEPHL